MGRGIIRPLALGLVRRGDEILVCEYTDSAKDERFCRPLGGGIRFGEYGHDALRREFREELGVELATARYLATVENVFTYEGQTGHEIVLLYETGVADPSFYERDVFEVDEDGTTLTARWLSPDALRGPGSPPLYPDGLLQFLLGEQPTFWLHGPAERNYEDTTR
jgi:ADP-ribose pyrophosphatase YjhB (NUDIX family)